jgi:uncharacterized membrane protein YhaH (DUF805 family)
MAITIGLFMLTIGTFLGGVWANESWGRYWGWDPKETWALVSVLVYAVILHLRMIPGLKGKFLFNVVSFWGYSAILFTFFGVNFMLVGLHSYAQGDGIGSIPNWLFYTITILYFLTELAALRNLMSNNIFQFDWKRSIKLLMLKIGIVLFIFLIILAVFYKIFETSSPLEKFQFSSFKWTEYLMFTLLIIISAFVILLPIKMGFAKFSGRSNRKELFYHYLFIQIISFILGVVIGLFGKHILIELKIILIFTVSATLLFPWIAVRVRRMHDIGKSGWFNLIPVYSIILLLKKGENDSNKYGKIPN